MPTQKSEQFQAINTDGSLDGIAVKQKASGVGAALRVDSDSTVSPAAVVQGAGDLLDLRDATGASQFLVSNTGGLTVNGNQAVTGNYTITGDLTVNGATVLNEAGADKDTRIEGDTNANLVFVDASTDRVGIGTATPGNLLDVSGGDLSVSTAGKGLKVANGANAKFGTLTLNGATPVVTSNTSVTADSQIFLTVATAAGTPAFSWVSAKTAATSFAVTGTAGDTSLLAYLIVEPA